MKRMSYEEARAVLIDYNTYRKAVVGSFKCPKDEDVDEAFKIALDVLTRAIHRNYLSDSDIKIEQIKKILNGS